MVEILVVIAILGILLAILLPLLGSVQARALTTQTISNLRQVFLAHMAYSIDHDGRLALLIHADGSQSWQDRLAPYVGNQLQSQRVDPRSVLNSPYQTVSNPNRTDWWNEGVTFGMNSFVMDPQWDHLVSRVERASEIVLAGDMVQVNCDFVNTSDGANWYNPGGGFTWALPAYRHHQDQKALFVFCDGHVEALTEADLKLNPSHRPSVWKWW